MSAIETVLTSEISEVALVASAGGSSPDIFVLDPAALAALVPSEVVPGIVGQGGDRIDLTLVLDRAFGEQPSGLVSLQPLTGQPLTAEGHEQASPALETGAVDTLIGVAQSISILFNDENPGGALA